MAAHTDGPIMTLVPARAALVHAHRWKTLGAGFAFFALSIIGARHDPRSEFIPASDDSFTELNIELPPGARLADTAAVSGRAYRIIARQPEVATVVE